MVRPLTSGYTVGPDLDLLFQLFTLFAGLLWMCGMVLRREATIRLSGLEIPLALYAAFVVASVFRASCLMLALETAFDWIMDLVLFFVVYQVARERGPRRGLERAFLATAMVVAAYGLVQRVKGFPEMADWIRQNELEAKQLLGFWDEVNWNDLHSRLATNEVFSTFVIPNALAGYFLMVLPLLAAALIARAPRTAWGRVSRGAKWLTLLLVCVCMALTGAKGAWACVPVQAIVFLLLLGGNLQTRLRRGIIGAIVVLLAVATALLVLVPPLQSYAYGLWDSLSVRFGYWGTGQVMLADKLNFLFGVGPNNFQELYPFYKTVAASEVQKAHNHYLQLWAEIGLFGLVAFVAAWVLCAYRSIRSQADRDGAADESVARKEDRRQASGSPKAPDRRQAPDRRLSPEGRSVLIGGAIAFLVACYFGGPFKNVPTSNDQALLAAIFFCLWCFYVFADSVGARASRNRRATRPCAARPMSLPSPASCSTA